LDRSLELELITGSLGRRHENVISSSIVDDGKLPDYINKKNNILKCTHPLGHNTGISCYVQV